MSLQHDKKDHNDVTELHALHMSFSTKGTEDDLEDISALMAETATYPQWKRAYLIFKLFAQQRRTIKKVPININQEDCTLIHFRKGIIVGSGMYSKFERESTTP